MDLVDDDIAQITEEPADVIMLVHQQGLQRFRRDLQDPGRILQQFVFVGLGNIPVPVPDGDLGLLAKIVQTLELIIDEGFEGADIQGTHGTGRILRKFSQDREKGGLGLAGSGGGGEQQVTVRVEDRVTRGDLDRPQGFPVVPVDEVLDEGGVTVKNAAHSSNSAKSAASAVSSPGRCT